LRLDCPKCKKNIKKSKLKPENEKHYMLSKTVENPPASVHCVEKGTNRTWIIMEQAAKK